MIITKLYTGNDGKSYFENIDCGHESKQPLGWHSKEFSAAV